MIITFSTFTSIRDKVPKPRSLPWWRFALSLTTHEERESKDGPLWSPAAFSGTRSRANVLRVSCLVADIDHQAADDTPQIVSEALSETLHVIHSTHSHTSEEPRFRVIVPLDKPASPDAWDELFARWRLFLLHCRIRIDAACSDPSRIFYLPACLPGAPCIATSGSGAPLRPERLPDLPKIKPKPVTGFVTTPERPHPDIIIDRAVQRAYGQGHRQQHAFWLGAQMRDNGYTQAEAESAALAYHARVSGFGAHPFKLSEALHGVKSAYLRAPREPWSRRTPVYAAAR